MAQILFSAGQRVQATRGGAVGAPTGFYAIVAPLPRDSGPQKYRVRGETEAFDRIMDESRLEAVTYD